MCENFGWILDADRPLDERTLIRLTDQLSHRGPDGSGHWLSQTANGQFQVDQVTVGSQSLTLLAAHSQCGAPMVVLLSLLMAKSTTTLSFAKNCGRSGMNSIRPLTPRC